MAQSFPVTPIISCPSLARVKWTSRENASESLLPQSQTLFPFPAIHDAVGMECIVNREKNFENIWNGVSNECWLWFCGQQPESPCLQNLFLWEDVAKLWLTAFTARFAWHFHEMRPQQLAVASNTPLTKDLMVTCLSEVSPLCCINTTYVISRTYWVIDAVFLSSVSPICDVFPKPQMQTVWYAAFDSTCSPHHGKHICVSKVSH